MFLCVLFFTLCPFYADPSAPLEISLFLFVKYCWFHLPFDIEISGSTFYDKKSILRSS